MRVHQLLPGRGDVEQRVPAGGDLAETGPQHQSNVGFLDPLRERGIDPDPDVAGIERVVVVEQVLEPERAGDGKLPGLREPPQVHARVVGPAAAAGNDDRPA